jgi:RNA 3'-terminal phosphate cyclase (ATP)
VSLVTLDGSAGEGGGQILRTALSLSAVLSRPVRVASIRAGRKQPGLRPQHVAAVKAVAALCNARVEGAQEHSHELRFEPQTPPQAGVYHFEIGTAGSATLLLQAVLVPLALASGPSLVTIGGGTHVAWSPPFDYVEQVFLPAIAPLGFQARLELLRWGFYPRGGGKLTAQIVGTQDLGLGNSPEQSTVLAPGAPAWSEPRGELQNLSVLSAAANVGNQVTARQASQAHNRLTAARLPVPCQTKLVNPPSAGPGTCVWVLAEYTGGVRAGFAGYGRQGYPAERVADDAVDGFLAFHAGDAAVDPHLVDQLILPICLTGRPVAFRTSEITQHLLTNVWVVERFLGSCFEVAGELGSPGEVRFLGEASDRPAPANG